MIWPSLLHQNLLQLLQLLLFERFFHFQKSHFLKGTNCHTVITTCPHLAISVQGICTSLTTSQINEADLAMFLERDTTMPSRIWWLWKVEPVGKYSQRVLPSPNPLGLFTHIFFLGGCQNAKSKTSETHLKRHHCCVFSCSRRLLGGQIFQTDLKNCMRSRPGFHITARLSDRSVGGTLD